MEFTFDTITFFSNFDSGNLANVEKLPQKILKPEEGTLKSLIMLRSNKSLKCTYLEFSEFWDTEFNLWTKPDAGGTTFENLNRFSRFQFNVSIDFNVIFVL